MPEKSSVFDMIGPVMIGPSSSHTAGVVRIGKVAREVLCSPVEFAEITFYNSFARTYEGHGSDKAVIAGLLGFSTEDLRIKEALEIARLNKINYKFKSVVNANTLHPNSIKILLKNGERQIEILGESKGGGVINIAEVNGFKADFSAGLHTLVIFAHDIKGSVAFIASVIANDNCNIANMSVSRKGKNDMACLVLEMDSGLNPITLNYMRSLHWVQEIVYIPNIIN